jgi:hypothetical protein|tara:strand:+ start:669 stop:845 length:177 start_codon:yes stop_codon:yes gene_type:complete
MKRMLIKMKKKKRKIKRKRKSSIQFAKLMGFRQRKKALMERNLNSIVDQYIAYNINLT